MIECPKCGYEHEPVGNHEEDAGERTCDECGFEFVVEVEYDPIYSVSCKTCEYESVSGYEVCRHCGAVKLV